MTRVDLPDGEWAEFCSPRKVSDRRRRAYISAQTDLTAATADLPKVDGPVDPRTGSSREIPDPNYMTGDQNELQFHALDLLILCFVKAWSFPTEVTLEAVEDLDTGSKDALIARSLPLMGDMLPDFSEDPDPKARTGGFSRAPTISPTDSTPATSGIQPNGTQLVTSADGTS